MSRQARTAPALRCGFRRSEWELEEERRSGAVLGLDPDPSAHALDELARDVQPEARPAHALQQRGIEAIELLEDSVALGLRNARAFVPDPEARPAAAPADSDLHRALGLAVLERVVDQILEYLPKLLRVGLDPRRGRLLRLRQGGVLGQMGMRGLDRLVDRVDGIGALDR